MIRSFRCRDTERLFQRESVRRFKAIERVARRKLDQLHFAARVSDLAAPPGNRLERLRGDREGQHSIRINNQWRVCFVWSEGNAHQVEIVDMNKLALDLRVPVTRIAEIVNERRGITADTALRLARYFKTTPQFWMNMQLHYELQVAEDELAVRVEREVRPMEPASAH